MAEAGGAAALVSQLEKFDKLAVDGKRLNPLYSDYESFAPTTDKVRSLTEEIAVELLEEAEPNFYRVPLLRVARLTTRDSKAKYAGDSLLFYKRNAVQEVWDAINGILATVGPDDRALHVRGQPGTGKSTAIWWKILSILVSKEGGSPKNILWVSLGVLVPKAIVYFQGTNYYELPILSTNLITVLLTVVDVDLVVIDGLTEDTRKLMAGVIKWVMNKENRKAIFSSSSKLQEEKTHNNYEIVKTEVHSWTPEEFQKAFVKDDGTPTEIYERCSPLLYEEFGLISSKTAKTEEPDMDLEDSGRELTIEDTRTNDVPQEISEALGEFIQGPVANASSAAANESLSDEAQADTRAEDVSQEMSEAPVANASPTAANEPPQDPSAEAQADATAPEPAVTEEQGGSNTAASSGSEPQANAPAPESNALEEPGSNKRQIMLSKDEIFEAIGGRYKYSGGSARWMFNYSRRQIDGFLDTLCTNTNFRGAIARGEIGPT